MQVVILAGGLGTRLSEETTLRPKPMVEIGGKPILWHIMKIYSSYGHTDFIVCLGYKGYMIKEYFSNYFLHTSDVTLDIANNSMSVHDKRAEPWRVTLVDTGDNSGTGGRLKRVRDYLDDGDFFFTYGDGVSDVNLDELLRVHRKQKTLATVTAVQTQSRYGELLIVNNRVEKFREKPADADEWINGGFFALSTNVIDYIDSEETHFELAPLTQLAEQGQLSAYRHRGFWQSMDNLRDKIYLEELWATENPPWRIWQ